ncbi:hypothetical protein PR048_003022, partial [Dryococelus australis]
MEFVQRLNHNSFLELEKFLCYLLAPPVTSATSENSFSTLRMLKSYPRTAMTQKRLNSLCILHVYGKLTDLNIEKLISEFINKNTD